MDDTNLQVVIPNLPDKISKHFLELYFRNKKHSGGGEIRKVEVKEDDAGRYGVVCFIEEDDVECVLQRNHSLQDQNVTVISWNDWTFTRERLVDARPQEHTAIDLVSNGDCTFVVPDEILTTNTDSGAACVNNDVPSVDQHAEDEHVCHFVEQYDEAPYHHQTSESNVNGCKPAQASCIDIANDGADDTTHGAELRTDTDGSAKVKVNCILSYPQYVIGYIKEAPLQLPKYPNCSVRLDTNFHQIVFDGQKDAVNASMNEYKNIISNIKWKMLDLTDAGRMFLNKSAQRRKIEDYIQSHDSSACMYETNGNYGIIMQMQDKDETALDELIEETKHYYACKRSIALSTQAEKMFVNCASEPWQILVSKYMSEYMVDISMANESETVIEGYYEDVYFVTEQLSDVIKPKTQESSDDYGGQGLGEQGNVADTDNPSIVSNANDVVKSKGEIQKFSKADVLVNNIATARRDLADCGAVSKAFARAGGSEFEKEIKCDLPIKDGQVVHMDTKKFAGIPAKLVLHAGISGCKVIKGLVDVVQMCFALTEAFKLKSIAFPALGCGRLNLQPYEVYQFIQNHANNYPNIKVYFVALDDPLYQALPPKTDQDQQATVTKRRNSYAQLSTKSAQATSPRHLSNNHSTERRESLAKKSPDIHSEKTNVRPTVSNMTRASYQDKPSDVTKGTGTDTHSQKTNVRPAVSNVTRTSNPGGATGSYSAKKTDTLEKRFTAPHSSNTGPSFKSRHAGTSSHSKSKGYNDAFFLDKMGKEIDGKCPTYWQKYKGSILDELKILAGIQGKVLYGVSPQIDLAIKKLVYSIWSKDQRLVGQGYDAAGIKHNATIQIESIQQIENLKVYKQYNKERVHLCELGAAGKTYPKWDIQGERDVKTFTERAPELKALPPIISQINERYLFHGTPSYEVAKAIAKQGLDDRLGNKNGLFGKGIYLAESPVKSDQYTDKREARNNDIKHMLLCRVLIGNPFVCKGAKSYNRPPCSKCYKERCTKHAELFDSVIGTHKGEYGSNAVRLRFREFVIYENDCVYPEFLIRYRRNQRH